MANRDLLKEAIADAKAVKETAIANAKAALEEAFDSRMKEMLSRKISEMDKEELEEADEKREEGLEEMYDTTEEAMDMEKMEEAGEVDEVDLEELLRELDEIEEGEKEEMMEGEEDLINNRGGAGNLPKSPDMVEEKEEEEEEEIDIENMDEDDLKKFIESVIADMVTAGELEGNIESEEGEEEDEEEESEEVEINERKKYGGNKGDVPASKRGDKKDTAEEEGVEDYKKKKKMKENYEMEEVDEAFDPSVISLSPEEFMQAVKLAGATISGLVGGGAALANKEEIGAALKGAFEKVKGKLGMAKTNEMEAELNEAYKTIKTIQTELQEVNLFNAKLLYTNKIFKAKNLTESQKVKILAAFDKAASVKEAKLVFETLSEGFKEKKSPVNESMLRGSASKVAGVAEKKPILEVNNQFARWQQLAGIKK
jgi:hypothetical protein